MAGIAELEARIIQLESKIASAVSVSDVDSINGFKDSVVSEVTSTTLDYETYMSSTIPPGELNIGDTMVGFFNFEDDSNGSSTFVFTSGINGVRSEISFNCFIVTVLPILLEVRIQVLNDFQFIITTKLRATNLNVLEDNVEVLTSTFPFSGGFSFDAQAKSSSGISKLKMKSSFLKKL